jgi:cobalt-zinc-cadmium efflux system membrane fusion protein
MSHPVHRLAAVAALLLIPACAASETPSATTEKTHDAIRLDPSNPKRSYVKVEEVHESEGAPLVSLTGRVGFDEEHTQRVASPIDGRVLKVLVQLGEVVKRGQALVELTSPRAAELTADAQKAEQDVALAEKAVARATKLKEDGAISDKESAQIEADYRKAKADASRTVAELRSLSLSLSGQNTVAALRAQIAGTVVDRNILVGQEVRADAVAPLLTISDLDVVWVLADLYEQDLALVTQGGRVSVKVPAYPGEVFGGRVDHVGDVIDPLSHTVKLRCTVANPAHRLKPEMFASIQLADAGASKAILLPSRAVLTDSAHARVIVAEGDVYRQRIVDVGPEVDGKVRVLRGVASGDKVVTDGAIFLKREMESD